MAEETGKKIRLTIEATDGTQRGFDSVKRGAQGMGASVKDSADKASKSLGGIGAGGEKAAADVNRDLRRMVNAIDRATLQTKALGKSQADTFRLLAEQKGIPPEVIEPYLKKLSEVEAQHTASGASAGQMTRAMGKLPRTFDSIAASLQNGQMPMLGMMRGGLQLRTVLSGVGAGATGLLAPLAALAALAAVVGVVALGYYKGREEAVNYQKALVMSGNMAGTTAGQLQNMADAIGDTGRSRSAAVEALTAIAGSGNVAAGSLQQFASAAIDWQKATGQAASETVKQFAELGKDPVQASRALDEQLHYLTASTYEQIKAAQEEGRTADAARIAQQAYSDALAERKNEVLKNTGAIEKGWCSGPL